MDRPKDNLQIIDTLRRLNRIFVQKRDTGTLLPALCKTLVSAHQFSSVWIALLDRKKQIKDFAHYGIDRVSGEMKEKLDKTGINYCARQAIEKGDIVLVDRSEENCQDCPMLDFYGDTKSLSLPVYFNDSLEGVIGLTVGKDYHLTEFERSLLLEFAEDLGNALNTINLEKGKAILSDTINRLTTSISGKSSKEVIDSFMENLVISLDADYAFIGRLIPGYHDRIKTISVCTPEGIIDNFEYELQGTPCFNVIQKEICCFSHGVADLFPEDNMLKEMGIEAYIGTPLFNSMNQVVGIMVVLKKSEFTSETIARYIFQVFASRASSELMRYETEQRILESENQYQELIEKSKNPIYIIVGNRFALVNTAWLQMFEYTLEEVMSPGFSINMIVAPESRELIQRRLDNFISGISQPFRYELKAVSRSGKKYDLDVSVTHLNWQGKRAVQGVYLNVTGIKKRERQLLKDLREANESSEMKTAFLANLSQEIQSYLRSIYDKASELSVKEPTSKEFKGFIDYILINNSIVLEHINDTLDISRIELGRLKLKPEKFILSDLMKDVMNFFTPMANDKGIEIACCKKKINTVTVEADPLRVRQVLINIISNAIKYTDSGKINLDYTIRQDDVRIAVSDTGIGMDPEKRKSIYKSFLDPNSKLSGNYDGSGLGLALTKSLVQMMNGKIWVEPNQDGGSTFFFTIPLA
jgi:PAS domain S-box-containing protein